MCGIYGQATTDFIHVKDILSKLKKITHRGPDDGDYNSEINGDQNIVLGHRRLKIIDYTSLNQQPLNSECKNYTIIFNGEIFNYKSIKKDLEHDYNFKTFGDTEVLLYSYIKWGTECLKKLRGMFSFAIYDKINNFIFVARDSLGKKPFYYRLENNSFEFSSELGPLKKKNSVIDPNGLNEYLAYGYIPDQNSLFNDIKKLPASSYGIYYLKEKNFLVNKFKSIFYSEQNNYINDKNYLIEKTWSLFKSSVKQRIENSDNGAGIFLSGGLDSSLIVAAASELNFKNIRTYSFTFNDSMFSEEEHSKGISQYFDTDHKNLKINSINNEDVSNILKKMSEPIADSSLIPFYLLSKNSVNHDKVILTGDGGDEVFGGYEYYKKLALINKFLFFFPDRLISIFSKISRYLRPGLKGKNFMNSFSYGKLNHSMISTPYFNQDLRRKLINKEYQIFLSEKINSPEDIRILKSYNDLINNILLKDIKFTLSNSHLVKVDRASMFNSQEIRSPFLDEDLINFSNSNIPSHLKASIWDTRILQKMIGKLKLPKNYNFNRKQGFSIPLSHIIKKEVTDYLFDNIDKNIFDTDFLEKIVKNKKDNLSRIYALYALTKSLEY